MLLSDAIRIGCAFKPQGFYNLINDDGSSCALGAALDGSMFNGKYSVEQQELAYAHLFNAFPYLNDKAEPIWCNQCNLKDDYLKFAIWHRNDQHKMSREDIADFVEQWEISNGYKEAAKPNATVKEINSKMELALA